MRERGGGGRMSMREGERFQAQVDRLESLIILYRTHFIPIATRKLIAPTKNITPRPTRVDADIHSSMMGINASLHK